jgi:hypothetical protein
MLPDLLLIGQFGSRAPASSLSEYRPSCESSYTEPHISTSTVLPTRSGGSGVLPSWDLGTGSCRSTCRLIAASARVHGLDMSAHVQDDGSWCRRLRTELLSAITIRSDYYPDSDVHQAKLRMACCIGSLFCVSTSIIALGHYDIVVCIITSPHHQLFSLHSLHPLCDQQSCWIQHSPVDEASL